MKAHPGLAASWCLLGALAVLAPALRAQEFPLQDAKPLLVARSAWAELPSLYDPDTNSQPAPTKAPHSLDLGPMGSWKPADILPFLGGGLLGLVIHESGHVSMGYALNAHPSTQRVSGSGVSFFAIRYGRDLSPREAYACSSAGFWFQYASSEWVLKEHPHLWTDDAPVAKGVFAFHLITSFVYAYAALSHNGPTARDTLGMAEALGIHERWIGVAVLVPAVLDLYRSFYPEARWAATTSRGFKLGFVLAVAK